MNDKLLLDIYREIDRLERLSQDAEWDLDFDNADRHWAKAQEYRVLADQGMLYVPQF